VLDVQQFPALHVLLGADLHPLEVGGLINDPLGKDVDVLWLLGVSEAYAPDESGAVLDEGNGDA
jgi:hypothetical protein